MDKVILMRAKRNDFIVNYEKRRFLFQGARANAVSKKEVPLEVYEWLAGSTSTFEDGELILYAETEEEKLELLDYIPEPEKYEANALTKEDAIAILKGNMATFTKGLEAITSSSTKKFILDIAKAEKIDNSKKQKFLKNWYYGEDSKLSVEDIFEE